jgi:hypothetical protein
MERDDDAAFAEHIENCRISNSGFRHADHIYLAWIYLRRHDYPQAEARMRESIRRLAAHAGAPHKYHETITIAWMRLVAVGIALSPKAGTFAEFSRSHPWLFDKDSVLAFWSRERLMDDAARARWVDPDLKPLPACAPR